ncbi:2-hydroxyhepta-2,4-diene-1,7-dioate isomerase, partial [bacterium M00.F.Ca.ET.155.01.1.1]
GAITDKGVVDLSARYSEWPTLREVIEAGALVKLAEEAERLAADFRVEDIAYEIPIPSPEKIICVGVNYPDRNEEYKDGQAAPSNPSLFIRFPRSFVGHGAPLVRPPESPQLDYE